MSYNNRQQYNTRFSGRFNTPGQFVSAGEAFSQGPPRKPMQQDLPPPPLPPPLPQEDISMEQEEMNQSVTSDEGSTRPYWMKTKLMGVKKISNKERRRRQNENLRRLLTPKNALMVLNEMMPNEQVTNQFKVEHAVSNTFKATSLHSFCADLTIEGNVYKGFGDNKLMARNAAAEQAIRDLIIKKMNKAVNSDSGSANGAGDSVDEEPLPMIQLASFALHKLFSEWEYEGHVVPQLKPAGQPPAAPAAPVSPPPEPAPRKPRELPAAASAMHPCMLLTHMRPGLEYREVAAETGPNLKPLFTMSVEVDGITYIGKGQNKKEARKLAAKAACNAIFDVVFDEDRQQQMH